MSAFIPDTGAPNELALIIERTRNPSRCLCSSNNRYSPRPAAQPQPVKLRLQTKTRRSRIGDSPRLINDDYPVPLPVDFFEGSLYLFDSAVSFVVDNEPVPGRFRLGIIESSSFQLTWQRSYGPCARSSQNWVVTFGVKNAQSIISTKGQ